MESLRYCKVPTHPQDIVVFMFDTPPLEDLGFAFLVKLDWKEIDKNDVNKFKCQEYK